MGLIRSNPPQPTRPLQDKWLAKDQLRTPSPPDSPNSPGSPVFMGSPKPYRLSESLQHLVERPSEYSVVIRERIARLQNSLPQLSHERLRQAKADIIYLRSILDDEGEMVAQVKAGAVFSAAT